MTAGESHGKGLVIVVEGMVAGLPLDEEYIARDLRRRQGGHGRGERMKIEKDHAEIISGVRHGKTMGSPIALLVPNRDWDNWKTVMSVCPVDEVIEPLTDLRPGHADLPGVLKYNLTDIRPVLERSSARETTARVAAGGIARRFLREFEIDVRSHTVAIGGHRALKGALVDWDKVESSPVRCADDGAAKKMVAAIDEARAAGNTVGGIFEVIVSGAPAGLGSHVHWDRRISGRLAQAVMSINAVKGVEIGDGFALAGVMGSEAHDVIEPPSQNKGAWRRRTNHAGGIEGGMTNGEAIVLRAVVKPIATMTNPLPSVNLATGKVVKAHYERSDICIVPAAGVVGEAMVALALADAMLEKFGGDHLWETRRNYDEYLKAVSSRFPLPFAGED